MKSSCRLSAVILYYLYSIHVMLCQEPTVVINQGTIVGVQIYPENYPNPIHAYMGIPYASPPTGSRRFAPPERHPGWNKTLYAANIPPNCPHLSAIQDSRHDTDVQNEDCLYLNIWTPIISKRMSTKVPIVVFFDGNNFANVNQLHPIPGQDLAAEGVIVVTANYRLNAFGFLCFGNSEVRGNMGLFDQYMVLLWIQENIEAFGGDPNVVTFMGYASGASSILFHLTSPRTKDLFSHVILMSSDNNLLINNYNSISYQDVVINNSYVLAHKVGCAPLSSEANRQYTTNILQCLRNASTHTILSAFYELYNNDHLNNNINIPMLGPVIDYFLPINDQYLIKSPLDAFKHGQLWNIPILIGYNNLEIIDDEWMQMIKNINNYNEYYNKVVNVSINKLINNILTIYNSQYINKDNRIMNKLIYELIIWKYKIMKEDYRNDIYELLYRLQLIYSHALYDGPIHRQIQLIQLTTQPIYHYIFTYADPYDLNRYNFNFTGSIHGNDLPFLFGPTLFQQITRRRPRHTEKYLMKQMKALWSNFIKFGYPTIQLYNTSMWKAFNDNSYIQIIGASSASLSPYSRSPFDDLHAPSASMPIDKNQYLHDITFWNQFLPNFLNDSYQLFKTASLSSYLLYNGNYSLEAFNGNHHTNVYRHATYTLTGLVVALLLLLFICIVLIKQRAKERFDNIDF